jgi:hypothetical protein
LLPQPYPDEKNKPLMDWISAYKQRYNADPKYYAVIAYVYGCLRLNSASWSVINLRISSTKSGRRFHRARKCTALRAELAAFRASFFEFS